MLKRVIVAVLALSLVVAACGDDDGGDLSESEAAVVDAIVAGMMDDPDPGNPFSDPESGRCFAEGMIQDMGMARLAEVGITADSESPEDAFALMTEAEVDDLVDTAFECLDIDAMMIAEFADSGISEDSARCVVAELNKTDFFRASFAAGMTGADDNPADDPEVMAAMLTAFTECLTPAELGEMMGG